MKIMISAGEVSGDVHGSYLVKELKKLLPGALFFGLGSERLATSGVDIRFDVTKRGTIGIFEALPNLLPLLSVFSQVKKMIRTEHPDLVIFIDSQGLNLPLARFCKSLNLKTVYYVAPQEWLWGTPKGVRSVAKSVGLLVAIFRQEYEAFKAAGANVVYFGHPLIDIVKSSLTRRAAREKLLGPGTEPIPVVCLCPGSRTQEIQSLFPILIEAARMIAVELPPVRFIIPAASSDLLHEISTRSAAISAAIVAGQTYDCLAASDLAICSSGTINLEASLLGIPNIMFYKLSLLTFLVGKYLLKIDRKLKYFSMPNLLLDRPVIPELIMSAANPESISREALQLLRSSSRLDEMKSAFARLRAGLGQPGMIERCARAIVDFSSI